MVVLDSFPFQGDDDVQYLGGVRRYAHAPSGLQRRTEICFNSPEASFADSRNNSSLTVYESREYGKQGGNSHDCMQFSHSQGFMEGAENSQGYLKCRLCSYQTKIESLLRRHVIKHSLDSDFRCPACDFRENDSSKFVDHIGTHQSGKLVRCCFCPKKMSRGKLKSHIRIHRAVGLYDCSMCQFSTNYENTIKSHMDVYHSKEHSCQHCGEIMTKHDLHWHMKFVHSMEPTEMSPGNIIPLPVPAGRGTNTKTSKLPNKLIPIQSANILPRRIGNISRKTSLALKMQKLSVTKKQFNCGKCEYKTPFKKLLRSHRAKHLIDNFLVCTKCGFKETGPGKFATHLALHSPNDLFECCFCGFQTPSRGTMSNHVTKHRPVPMFDCSECEFSARRPASVRTHMKRRHGKRMQCRTCGLEMSRFAMVNHRKKCSASNIPDCAAGALERLETENYESPTEPDIFISTGSNNQADENTVTCEFCKKPYAKSYVRKHVKKCILEYRPDLESRKNRDGESIIPDPQSGSNNLTNSAPTVQNPNVIGERIESSTSHESTNKPQKPRLQCNSCSFKTRKKCLLKKHVVKHLIDFRLTCPVCGHKEMSSFRFAHHILKHGTDPETFQCCFCSLSAPTSKRSYCAHLDLHRPVNIFDCPKCEYSSNRADCVRNHVKNNHSKNRKCQHCGEVMSKARLIKHFSESHGLVKDANFKLGKTEGTTAHKAGFSYSYPTRTTQDDISLDESDLVNTERQCDEGNLQDSAENQMALANHNPSEIELPLVETEKDILKCTKCAFKTKIQSLMDRHIAKHLIDVPFVCPLCGFEHHSSRKFANHWDKHECNAKKIYQCCFCDTEIKKKNCLKAFLPQHIEDHRLVALQDCSECEFSSHSRYELDKHYKNQHLKKCKCLLCGEVMTIFDYSSHTACKNGNLAEDLNKSVETANSINHHSVDFGSLRRRSAEVQDSMIAALEDPTFLLNGEPSALTDESSKITLPGSRPTLMTKEIMHCSSCDYNTQFKSLLERHVFKHLIDIPFACKHCSFSSFDERTFADHVFTHTGNYKCVFCPYRAGNYTVATRHYSSHKALAINDCPKCEFTSTYKYRLIEHLKGKHVVVPRCSYCGKKMLKDELNSHEDECSILLRSVSHFESAGTVQMLKDEVAVNDTSPRALLERFARSGALLKQDSGLKDELVSSVPTQEHPRFDVESCHTTDDILARESVHTSAEIHSCQPPAISQLVSAADSCCISSRFIEGMVHESKAVSNSPSPEPGVAKAVGLASSAIMSTLADQVPTVMQESNDPAVGVSQNAICPASRTETFPCADEDEAVIQESKSPAVTSTQESQQKPLICSAYSAATSPHAFDVQTLSQESISPSVLSNQAPVLLASSAKTYTHAEGVPIASLNSAALMSSQHPGLISPSCITSPVATSSLHDDVPNVIPGSNSTAIMSSQDPFSSTPPISMSPLHDDVPIAPQESNSVAIMSSQDPGLISPFGQNSPLTTPPLHSDVPILIPN